MSRAAAGAFATIILAAACSGGNDRSGAGTTEPRRAVSVSTVPVPAAPAAERDGDADGSAEACPENRLWADCPEAAWASRVAERAGFAVTGDTQSALIVEGRGASFYLWATPLTKPVAEIAVEEGWRRLGRSGGAAVYGDGRLWQWWVAQQRVVWLKAGPTPSARLPTLTELAALVRAGRELAVTAK